jgi:serine/threonine protein kinase
MWMAPEALQGRKIPPALAPALDVYSYGIVMWEIWTCAEPWSEIAQDGIQFCSKLIELVSKGVRPQRPPGCESAPEGYHDLMDICWNTQADRRPSMSVVLSNIEYIIKPWTTTESAL